jgi:small subunit ribosomal protein S20
LQQPCSRLAENEQTVRDINAMANTSSAKKAARQMITRTARNKSRRTRMKSSVRNVEEAIASGDKVKAAAALKEVEPVLVRTAQKGVVHKKAASRKVSRLAARVKSMA